MLRFRKPVKSQAPAPHPFDLDYLKTDAAVRLRPDFHFIHEPVSGTDHFAGRAGELDELIMRLLFSTGGSFLVTGYRGVGKTSFVNHVVRTLKRALPWANQHLGLTHIADVYLSLARPVEPAALMHYIVRRLHDRLCELDLFRLLPHKMQADLVTAYRRTTFNMVTRTTRSTESTVGKETGIDFRALKASLKFPVEFKATQTSNQEFVYLGYDDRAAEYDIVRISQGLASGFTAGQTRLQSLLSRLSKRRPPFLRLKLIFVFDELDKLGDEIRSEGSAAESYIDYIFGSLKTLFTTSGISFVFVAGKDLHERWLDDVGHGDSIYESVFSYDRYLGCLWADAKAILDASISEVAFSQPICGSCRQSWRQGEVLCSSCGKYLKDGNDARAAYQDFSKYVAFRGRGIPRRIIRTFNQAVRWHGQWPILAFTREERRVHRLFAELTDVLADHEGELYPEIQEESPGARSDRLRLAVHYVIDWMIQQGKSGFSAGDLMRWSEHLSRRIAPDATVFAQVVARLIEILLGASLLEVVQRTIREFRKSGPEGGPEETRYRVRAHWLNALGVMPDLLPEDIAIIEPSADLGRCGKYKLLRRLATGGMSTIYLASDSVTGKLAIVKMLLAEFGSTSDGLDRFRQEAAILSMLHHRNIVQFYQSEEEGGRPYIAMEYIDGIDVGEVIKASGRFSPELALSIAIQVADALAYAHSRNVLRNDVSPRNIMLSRNGRVELIDFGIAVLANSSGNSVIPTVAGTPPYMAPESFRPNPADPRSDVYGLGVVLYEMVTGRKPFQSGSIGGFEEAHRSQKPTPLSEFEDVPKELEAAILKALEKDLARRYRSMIEFREALLAVPGDSVPTGIGRVVADTLRAKKEEDVKTSVPDAPSVLRRETPPPPGGGPGEFTRMFAPPGADLPEASPAEKLRPSAPGEFTRLLQAQAKLVPGPPAARSGTQPVRPDDTRMLRTQLCQLRVVGGSTLRGQVYSVSARVSIGRSKENDIVLDNPKVSRFHAEVFQKGNQYFVSDLHTANGTKLNGIAIRQPAALESGYRIEIGEHQLEFWQARPSAQAAHK
jgi:serine/threonine-protein kinase